MEIFLLYHHCYCQKYTNKRKKLSSSNLSLSAPVSFSFTPRGLTAISTLPETINQWQALCQSGSGSASRIFMCSRCTRQHLRRVQTYMAWLPVIWLLTLHSSYKTQSTSWPQFESKLPVRKKKKRELWQKHCVVSHLLSLCSLHGLQEGVKRPRHIQYIYMQPISAHAI